MRNIIQSFSIHQILITTHTLPFSCLHARYSLHDFPEGLHPHHHHHHHPHMQESFGNLPFGGSQPYGDSMDDSYASSATAGSDSMDGSATSGSGGGGPTGHPGDYDPYQKK